MGDEESDLVLTHLVLHEFGELVRIVAAVDDVLHQIILFHCTHLFVCVLVLVQGGSWLRNSVHIDVVGGRLELAVQIIDHVIRACRKDLISCYNY